jgi:uncharacterized membrane protein YphA (DoxX/SURF4 family)
MNTLLWVIQIILAAFFLMAGSGKLISSKQQHIENGHIKPGGSVTPIWLLGVLELLGCVGIIVPWLTGIFPILTPVTAVCFGIIMTGALVIHIQRKQYKFLPLPILVITLVAVVAYYRFTSILNK